VLDGGDHQVLDVFGGDTAVAATCPIAWRSQQSSAKATRTFSPLSQPISSASVLGGNYDDRFRVN
jgi:hypothetical protein